MIYSTPLSKSLSQKKIPGNEHLESGPIFEGVFLLLQILRPRTVCRYDKLLVGDGMTTVVVYQNIDKVIL